MDVLIAKVGVVAAVLLLGLQLFASQPFLLVIPVAIGTGSGLYLLTGHEEGGEHALPTLRPSVAGFLPSVVLVGLTALVVATRVAGTRSMPIYLLIGAIGAVIFVQILLVADEALSPGLLLVEILAAALVVRLSALFVTPGYVGVDIWTHALVFTDGIARQGTLGSLQESKYIMAPFYHLIGAIGTQAFGSVREGIYLTMGVLLPLSAVFVYATGRLLVPARWALLATALYAFADQFIRWGMHIIPTSLGLVFFLALVYLVARTFVADAEPWAVLLATGLALAVVFTHQVATAITLVFLGIAVLVAVARWLTVPDDRVAGAARSAVALGGVFVVTLVTTLVSWANTPFGGDTFLWRELAVLGATIAQDAGFLNLAGGGGGGPSGGSAAGWLVPYIELVGFALLLAGAVLGGLLLLRRTVAPDVALTLVLVAAVMFVFVFGLSLFGIRALLPGRWLAFLYAPMALLAAAGVFQVARSGNRTLVVVAVLVLALGYPTTMVVAEKATLDSPAFDEHHARFAYTGAELGALEAGTDARAGAGGIVVRTDHPYYTVFEVYGGYEDGSLVLGPDGPENAEVTAARDYQATGPVSFDAPEDGSMGDPATDVCPDTWNTVYANDQVRLCTEASGGAA